MSNTTTQTEIHGDLIDLTEGLFVEPDSWRCGAVLARNELVDMLGLKSEAATFVQGHDVILPLSRIEITGRMIRWEGRGPRVRVRLTFWDEDGGETTTGGWVYPR